MNACVIYDSVYGNTEQVARAIAQALGSPETVAVLRAADVQPARLAGVQLLIVGSPTQRFRPTAPIGNLLQAIPANGLKGVKVAAFDTRLAWSTIEQTPVLAFFVRLFGAGAYAARSIADRLKGKGGWLAVPPEGFVVTGMEGPLAAGELERAAGWARQIVAAG